MLVETQRSILDRAQLLLLIVIVLGPYEAATFFYAVQVLVLTLPLTSHPLTLSPSPSPLTLTLTLILNHSWTGTQAGF